MTFASEAFEELYIIDMDLAAAVTDGTGGLKTAGFYRHAWTPDAYHLCEVVLRHGYIAANQIKHPQQPSCHTLIGLMNRVASGSLLDIRIKELFMRGYDLPDCVVVPNSLSQPIAIYDKGIPGHLNINAIEGNFIIQRLCGADYAILPYHGCVNAARPTGVSYKRDDSRDGKIDVPNFLARLRQGCSAPKLH